MVSTGCLTAPGTQVGLPACGSVKGTGVISRGGGMSRCHSAIGIGGEGKEDIDQGWPSRLGGGGAQACLGGRVGNAGGGRLGTIGWGRGEGWQPAGGVGGWGQHCGECVAWDCWFGVTWRRGDQGGGWSGLGRRHIWGAVIRLWEDGLNGWRCCEVALFSRNRPHPLIFNGIRLVHSAVAQSVEIHFQNPAEQTSMI